MLKFRDQKTRGGRKMRTKITLACTECKQRNYNMTKEKKLNLRKFHGRTDNQH